MVAKVCSNPADNHRLALLEWWYGTVARQVNGAAAFSYPAPAGNGTVELRVWDLGTLVTVAATFGLTPDESADVLASVGTRTAQ